MRREKWGTMSEFEQAELTKDFDKFARRHSETDFTKADLVEVRISPDGTKIWLDVDGINRFRVYNTKRVIVHDDR